MIHYVVLTTGSCGNCYVISDEKTTIVIDCGVTFKKLGEETAKHDIDFSTVSAMFLTHLHPDHAKGVGVFQRKTMLPVFTSSESFLKGKTEMLKQKIELDKIRTFKWGDRITVGSFTVIPFKTSHDSPGSSGYYIEHEDASLFLMTDTGLIPEDAYVYAKQSKVKFIEANYDPEMLDNGPYPLWLRERVKGCYGHLSNGVAVDFAREVSKHGDQIYFIHVSENNNSIPILKKLAYSKLDTGIFCKCCERGEMFEGFIE